MGARDWVERVPGAACVALSKLRSCVSSNVGAAVSARAGAAIRRARKMLMPGIWGAMSLVLSGGVPSGTRIGAGRIHRNERYGRATSIEGERRVWRRRPGLCHRVSHGACARVIFSERLIALTTLRYPPAPPIGRAADCRHPPAPGRYLRAHPPPAGHASPEKGD